MRIDLHLHTTASDGSLDPSELARAAHAAGLAVIAVTDHDTIGGVMEAQAAAPPELTVVAGIEVSCTWVGADAHILGYFVDPRSPALLGFVATAAERRHERMQGMIRRLEPFGVTLSIGEVLSDAGGRSATPGRPHLARALLRRGYVATLTEAFDRYLGDGKPAYLPTDLLTPRQAIELIHEAGGAAVWAHPEMARFDRELRRFVDWGLDGVECYRPATSFSDRHTLEATTSRLGLLRSGGSDWHGEWHGRLGAFAVTRSVVGQLLERGGISAAAEPAGPHTA